MGKGTLKVSLPANNDSDIGEKGKVEYGKYTGDEEQLVNNGYHCNSGQVMKKVNVYFIHCFKVRIDVYLLYLTSVDLYISLRHVDHCRQNIA